jgi:hypothetical protein
VDPYAILGVKPGAPPSELATAYRREAKRWHPDRGGGEESVLRMAQVNAAYDLLRAGDFAPPSSRAAAAAPAPAARGRAARPALGAWLAPAIRRALGRELLEALEPEEDVRLVTPTATWASARALLAVTDRRLLWLLDDVVASRVGWLRFTAIASVEQRLRRPRRRVAVLRIETTAGRRLAFAELRPATAEAIARHIATARRAA